MATNDSIASPVGEVSPESSCYATVWEAVKSVPRARIWQNALERTGLNLVIDTPNYRGTVFLVQDDGSSPLLIASNYGHQDVVEFFCSLGAENGTPNRDGLTPILAAPCA